MDKNIHQRVFEASKALGHIAKKGKNSAQGYDYVQAADVIAEVRQVAFEHGILLVPSVSVHEPVNTDMKSRSGTQQALTRIVVRLTAINLDDPKDTLEIQTVGDGIDPGDKGPYKAMTGALKYALLYMFMLPQGDDPEKDEPAKKEIAPPKRASEKESDPPADKVRKELWDRCLKRAEGSETGAGIVLSDFSSFEAGGKTVPGKTDVNELSDKWALSTLKKIRTADNQPYDEVPF